MSIMKDHICWKILLLTLSVLSNLTAKGKSEACIYSVIENVSGMQQDQYIFHLFGMGLEPTFFPDCQPANGLKASFVQLVVISSPVVPIESLAFAGVNVVLYKHPSKLSANQFDIIITPTCTPYYPQGFKTVMDPVFQNIEDKRMQTEIFRNKTYKYVDEYGQTHYQGFVTRPTTIFLLIKNCPSVGYMNSLARYHVFTPTILLVDPVNYDLFLLKHFRSEVPLGSSLLHDFTCMSERFKIGQQVLSTVHFLYFKYMYADRYPSEHPSDCQQAILKLSPVCDAMVMTILTLARQSNNQSVIMYNYYSELDRNLFQKATPYSVHSIIPLFENVLDALAGRNVKNDNTIFALMSTYIVVSFDHIKLIYCKQCKNDGANSVPDFTTWIYPFNKYMWVFGCFLVSMDLFSGVFSGNVLKTFSFKAVTKQNLLRIYLFVTLFAVMMIRGYYENQITGLVIVPENPQPYKTLDKLFSESFKLIVVPDSPINLLDPLGKGEWPMLRKEFEFHGVANMLNSSIMRYKLVNQSYTDLFKQHFTRSKLVYMTLNSMFKLDFDIIQSAVPRTGVTCFVMPTELYNTMTIYQMHLYNRNFYQKSYQFLQQSGLTLLWRIWSQHGDRLRRRIYFGKGRGIQDYSVGNMDDIKLEKILAVVVVSSGIMFIALVIFVIECLLVNSWCSSASQTDVVILSISTFD